MLLATTSLPVFVNMRSLAIAFLITGVVGQPLSAADWHQFRGPQGQGHADAHDLPTRWSETENVVWKVAIPGEGHSSPIVVNDQIWLTSAQEKGRSLRALCVERGGGKIIHNVELFRLDDSGPKTSRTASRARRPSSTRTASTSISGNAEQPASQPRATCFGETQRCDTFSLTAGRARRFSLRMC